MTRVAAAGNLFAQRSRGGGIQIDGLADDVLIGASDVPEVATLFRELAAGVQEPQSGDFRIERTIDGGLVLWERTRFDWRRLLSADRLDTPDLIHLFRELHP